MSKTLTIQEIEAFRAKQRTKAKRGAKKTKPASENTITQILNATDAILSGQAITHCPCPPASLTPAQQLMRQAFIQRGQELAEQGNTGTSVAEADLANCPDCTYCERDDGLLAVKAFGLFTLGHASNCMATGDTEGIPPTAAYKCQHCEGSYTAPHFIIDITQRDPYAERELVTVVYCRECEGMSGPGGKGISLFTTSTDVCDAASLTARTASDGEVAALLVAADDADIFWFERTDRAAQKKGAL